MLAPSTPLKQNSDGFALFEAVIAAGLLATVMLVFLSIWMVISIGSQSQYLVLAHHVASSRIDELRQTAFESLPVSGAFIDPMLADLPNGSANLVVSNYRGVADMKHIQVVVSWTTRNAVRTHSLETIISRGSTLPPQ